MFKVLFTSSTSACFELTNQEAYYAPESYTIYLNGKEMGRKDTNVFSLFGLTPDSQYVISLQFHPQDPKNPRHSEEVAFSTKKESCAINVRDFGAVGDGVTDDTIAIQTAVHFLPKDGRLYFPAGTYQTLPIACKSHMTLEFAEGAVLLGSTKREAYPVLPGTVQDMVTGKKVHFGAFEGLATPMNQALICGEYATDITVIGPGTVDGNAQNTDFWTNFKTVEVKRPRLFFFNRCQNVRIHGITACNSASWQFHPYFSDHIGFYDIMIKAPKVSPNTDAIDPEACDDVQIIGCRFSVGDDCIAIKSGKIELAMEFQKPADHHTIRNCLMEFGHGAVTLGSEIGGGVRNLTVTQCLFRGTDRGLRIKTRRGRGKFCEITNVVFDNIRMDGVLTPIVMNMWYNCCDPDCHSEYVWSRDMLPVDERTPHLGSFRFTNMECTNAQVAACYIDGLPEMPIDDVTMENVSVSFAEECKPGVPAMMEFAKPRARQGLYFDNVRKIVLKNVKVTGCEGERIIANHYEDIREED